MEINLLNLAIGLFGGGTLTGFIIWLSTRKATKREAEYKADTAGVRVDIAGLDAVRKAIGIYQGLNDNLIKELNRERDNSARREAEVSKQIKDLKADFEQRLEKQDRKIGALTDEIQIRAKAQGESEALYALSMQAIAQQGACQTPKMACPIALEYERLIKEVKK